ncbi:MAG: hypothetical protein DRG78_11100 [Epsilonproteobacteria bacterium]|nr:MAG: hypothetical protein DRG78_11100 [Campylobacterota bacterium]
MNSRSHINNMGIKKISWIDNRAVEMFKENNEYLVEGLSDKEIHNIFHNSTTFAMYRLSIAFSNFGGIIKKEVVPKKSWKFWR